MRQIPNHSGIFNGDVTFEISENRFITFKGEDVRMYGLPTLIEGAGLAVPDGRSEVWQRGRLVGTVPILFDPRNLVSKTILYEYRAGDFEWDGNQWVADKMLGPDDLDAIEGFERIRDNES